MSDETKVETSPSSGYNSFMTVSPDADCDDLQIELKEEEQLLIVLNSPVDEINIPTDTWNGLRIVDTDANNHECELFARRKQETPSFPS